MAIQGQMLRRSARREVAIYLRGSALWVADFIDGDGEFVDAATWIRFNCASASAWQARCRMVRESALPVSRELSLRIERLHDPDASAASDATGARGCIARFLRRTLRRRVRRR